MKLIVINAAATRHALHQAVHALRQRRLAVMERAVVNIAYQRLVRNPLARSAVTEAGPDDPAWVAERVAEGGAVWRVCAFPYMYRREVREAHVHVDQIMRVMHDALDACIDGHGAAGRLAKLLRLVNRMPTMSVEDFDAARACWGVRQRACEVEEPISLEMMLEGEGLPQEVLVFGAYRMRACNSISQIVALGETLNNCLVHAGDSWPSFERYHAWTRVYAIEADDAVIGAACFSNEGKVIEAFGPRNAELAPEVLVATERLADRLRPQAANVVLCDALPMGDGNAAPMTNRSIWHRSR